MTVSEQRGMRIFQGERAECFHCHIGYNFTNNAFRNNGVAADEPDKGRWLITENPADEGKFKVPTLRNVGVTAPYLHDGSLATLEDVVDHYTSGGGGHPNTDPLIHQFSLTAEEKADLVAFLRALTDEQFLTRSDFKP